MNYAQMRKTEAKMLVEHLKNKMAEKGVSVHALEKQAGLKSSAIHNILYGRSKNPSIRVIKAIADALECDIAELIEDRSTTTNNNSARIEPKSTTKEDVPWDSALYLDSFEEINSLINKNKLSLTKEKILNIVEEVYTYSQNSGKNKVDSYFAEWIINKYN